MSYLSPDIYSNVEQIKDKFEEKIRTSKFVYIVRRRGEYEKLIKEIDENTKHLNNVLIECLQLKESIIGFRESFSKHIKD